MEWRDDPASDKQIGFLKELGHVPDRSLSKGEARDLISQLVEVRDEQRREKEQAEELDYQSKHTAFWLHIECEQARQQLSEAEGRADRSDSKLELQTWEKYRILFWSNTFLSLDKREQEEYSEQEESLYEQYGCRFKAPTRKQIVAILSALDGALPEWDRDLPVKFYETLHLNFPDLLRSKP